MTKLDELSPATQEQIQELRDALAVEDPAGWMAFMERVKRIMPSILSVGRPTAEMIAASPIGEAGFKSWREMIEAPKSESGLEWNFSAWKAWRKAWGVIQEYPYLREMPLASAPINALKLRCEREGVDFPASKEAFEALIKERERQKEAQKKETLATLKTAITEATKQAAVHEARTKALEEQLEKERSAAQQSALAAGKSAQEAQDLLKAGQRLEQQLAEARHEIDALKKQIQSVPQLSRWQLVKLFFGLNNAQKG